jgi:hypothetical protein
VTRRQSLALGSIERAEARALHVVLGVQFGEEFFGACYEGCCLFGF